VNEREEWVERAVMLQGRTGPFEVRVGVIIPDPDHEKSTMEVVFSWLLSFFN
jgi:hypothetical protein